MSDDEEEYNYDYGSDADDQDGEPDEENSDIEIENTYYEGEENMKQSPREAIELFDRVVELEASKPMKWRFKALQHLVILRLQNGEIDQMFKKYNELLTHLPTVSKNDSTEAINTVLTAMETKSNAASAIKLYEITLDALKNNPKVNNERLWFNTNLKLARLYLNIKASGLEEKPFPEVERIITELKSTCRLPNGNDDTTKGSSLLEIYCVEVLLCQETSNWERLKTLYGPVEMLKTAVTDPRSMGVICEAFGKMHMEDVSQDSKKWQNAFDQFYKGFINFQEAGNGPRAKTCLKYVVLASILALSGINPFAARETKVYEKDEEIVGMSSLRTSLETNDLRAFEYALVRHKIEDDPFIKKFISPLRVQMRQQKILSTVRPYRRAKLAFLAFESSMSVQDIEDMCALMILDDKLHAIIDQTGGYLEMLSDVDSIADQKMKALSKYSDSLDSLFDGYANRFVY